MRFSYFSQTIFTFKSNTKKTFNFNNMDSLFFQYRIVFLVTSLIYRPIIRRKLWRKRFHDFKLPVLFAVTWIMKFRRSWIKVSPKLCKLLIVCNAFLLLMSYLEAGNRFSQLHSYSISFEFIKKCTYFIIMDINQDIASLLSLKNLCKKIYLHKRRFQWLNLICSKLVLPQDTSLLKGLMDMVLRFLFLMSIYTNSDKK